MEKKGIPYQNRLVNCPSCPVHPESVWGTLAYVVSEGYPDVDPKLLTPTMFYAHSVHDRVSPLPLLGEGTFRQALRRGGMSVQAGLPGTAEPHPMSKTPVEWRSQLVHPLTAPCISCTSETFAKRKDFPFYRKGEESHRSHTTNRSVRR